MGFELRQDLRLTQQLIMTPQLQMSIKLLQLSRLELVDMITQELKENPALEEVIETVAPEQDPEQKEAASDESEVKDVTIEEKISDDIDWSNYLDEYNSPGRINFETEKKDAAPFETFIARRESLTDHLLWQLLMTLPSEEEEKIGSLIIGNFNKDGYLDNTIEAISEKNNFPIEKIEKILSLIQSFDPVGVGARNLSECLLIQIRHLKIESPVLTEIITHHIKNLENKNYKAICRAMKININDVIAAVDIIKGLEPKPGRQFSEEESQYINPDIFVYKDEDKFVITLNDDGMPRLRINQYYRQAMAKGEKVSGKTKEYLQEKMKSATWLIRSIHQRQKTIYRVMESILKFQEEFFEKGIACLKPMVLRDVAQDIEMHESTISRVTTNKYAYTPQGIFELKYFFNSSISRIHGESMASTSVQDKIKKIIEGENPKKPYSDEKIAVILKNDNINIARRTVAKYREILGLLPSNKRKQF